MKDKRKANKENETAETAEKTVSAEENTVKAGEEAAAGKASENFEGEVEASEMPENLKKDDGKAPDLTPDDPAAVIDDLKKKLSDMERMRLCALAEMDNQRKRLAKEMESVRLNTTQDTLFPFLQVYDHFKMAVDAAAACDNVASLVKGMEMIQTEFDKAFTDLGVEKIDAVGKEFDPKFHEAVAQEASDTVPAGKIIRQWSLGYKTGDRLIKPAVVIVSSGPASQTEEKKD